MTNLLQSARRVATLTVLAASVLVAPRVQAQSGAADYKLVVNAANPVSALTRDEVSRLFLKKTTTWRDAKPVLIVDQRPTTAVRAVFTREVHGRQVASVTSYWQQMIFAGRAVPPIEKATDADVVAYVQSNPSAIGYVSASADLPDGVKMVAVTK